MFTQLPASLFQYHICLHLATHLSQQYCQPVRSWRQDENEDKDQEDEVSILQFMCCQFARQAFAVFVMPHWIPTPSLEITMSLKLAVTGYWRCHFVLFPRLFQSDAVGWAPAVWYRSDTVCVCVQGLFVSQCLCVFDMWTPLNGAKLKRFFTSTDSPCPPTC